MIEFDIGLIKKYDKPGPRYTSYPTAPHFTDKFTRQQYLAEIISSNKGDSNSSNNDKGNSNKGNPLPDISLYFHIPFCDTLCYFCGCNTIISKNRTRIAEYVDYLKKEIAIMLPHINNTRMVTQIHWGGGTPTHLNPDEIIGLQSYINSSFNIRDSAEHSCEIDPRGLTKAHLEALRETGFNRISMGVQDFNPEVQKSINRIQSEELTRKVAGWVRELEFESLNLDLIYGLPHQNCKEFERTVKKIIDINPDRIALFNFAYVPWMKSHMKLINRNAMPSPEEKLNILKMAIEKLTANGYEFIGMDHFAKPDDELTIALKEKKLYRNLQGYSTNAGADLYAFGSTSISQLGNIYAQNHKEEKLYYEAIDRAELPMWKGYMMNEDDKIRRHVIMKIMCDFELDFDAADNYLRIDSRRYFAIGINKLKPMIDDGLLTLDSRRLVVSGRGRMMIRNIAMCFDGYIERQQDHNRYSKTL